MFSFRFDIIYVNNPMTINMNSNKKYQRNPRREARTLVQCRNYLSKVKWCFGKIEKGLSTRRYFIKVYSGHYWKRHINQIRDTGREVQDISNNDSLNTQEL